MSRGGFLSILLLALSMMVACEKDDSDLSAYMEKVLRKELKRHQLPQYKSSLLNTMATPLLSMVTTTIS